MQDGGKVYDNAPGMEIAMDALCNNALMGPVPEERYKWKHRFKFEVEEDFMDTPIGRAEYFLRIAETSKKISTTCSDQEILSGVSYKTPKKETRQLILEFCVPNSNTMRQALELHDQICNENWMPTIGERVTQKVVSDFPTRVSMGVFQYPSDNPLDRESNLAVMGQVI
jgi:hypothetical protein